MVLIFDAHSFDDIYCFDLCKIWCFVYRWTIRRPMARKMMLAALTTIQSMIKAKKQVCDFLSSRCNLDIFCVSLLHFFLYFKLLIARTHLLIIDVICREHKSNNKFLQIKWWFGKECKENRQWWCSQVWQRYTVGWNTENWKIYCQYKDRWFAAALPGPCHLEIFNLVLWNLLSVIINCLRVGVFFFYR